MASSDYGGGWWPLAEKVGRLEADHRVLKVEHKHTRAHLEWLEAQHSRLAAALAAETTERKSQVSGMRKTLGSEMSALRDKLLRGALFLMVAVGVFAAGAPKEAGEMIMAAIKARLGG